MLFLFFLFHNELYQIQEIFEEKQESKSMCDCPFGHTDGLRVSKHKRRQLKVVPLPGGGGWAGRLVVPAGQAQLLQRLLDSGLVGREVLQLIFRNLQQGSNNDVKFVFDLIWDGLPILYIDGRNFDFKIRWEFQTIYTVYCTTSIYGNNYKK